MPYLVPGPASADFNLEDSGYFSPAGASAVNFNILDSGELPIVYPIPPGIMVTSSLAIELTSSAPVSSSGVGYSMTPAQKAVRRMLRAAMASKQFDGRSPQQWDKVSIKDELIAEGVQPWRAAEVKNPEAKASRWDPVAIKDADRGGPAQSWDSSIRPIDQRSGLGYDYPPAKDVIDRQSSIDSAKYWEQGLILVLDGYAPGASNFNLVSKPYNVPGAAVTDFNLSKDTRIVPPVIPTRPLFSALDPQGWTTNKPTDNRFRHPWDDKPRKGTEVDFDYDQQPPLPGDPPDEPEIKRTYIIMNSSSLIATAENMPLEFSDLTIELDVDSFAWKMSCSILNRQSMDLIRPTAQGPAEVVATVNGHQWRFIVERYSLDKRFAKEQWRVTGVSRPQLLANPYAPRRTGRIEQPTNMALAMANQLEFTGFTVALQDGLYDYVIPAGAWGYENKTAMEVISELAAAVGAVVIPDQAADILHIKHRYKQTPPWYYPGLAESDLDAVIQDSMVIGYSSQWEPQPEYNYVFVSGITAGVSTEVIRQGSAGDQPAPDIYDELNVETQQCRLRGVAALSAGGNQEIVTIETILPTSGSPGLIVPAMLVEYRDTREPSATWRGNVLGVSINVSKPGASRVIQNVKIERHHY